MKSSLFLLPFLTLFAFSACQTESSSEIVTTAEEAPEVSTPQTVTLNPQDPMTTENISTVDGLEIYILQEGNKDKAPASNGDTVSVHYIGTLENGKEFDQSYSRGEAFDFMLGAGYVIQGWDLGVLGMHPGEKRRLKISPELGYGPRGAGGVIPGNATLYFDVELLEIIEE